MKKIFYFVIILIGLSACTQQSNTNDYLLLTGESEHWKLSDYEILLTPNGETIGNGKLIMKNANEYFTDSFSFRTYVVVDGTSNRIHTGSVSGKTDISKQTTGKIEKDGHNANALSLKNIDNIYIEVEWTDQETKGNKRERIDLYNKSKDKNRLIN